MYEDITEYSTSTMSDLKAESTVANVTTKLGGNILSELFLRKFRLNPQISTTFGSNLPHITMEISEDNTITALRGGNALRDGNALPGGNVLQGGNVLPGENASTSVAFRTASSSLFEYGSGFTENNLPGGGSVSGSVSFTSSQSSMESNATSLLRRLSRLLTAGGLNVENYSITSPSTPLFSMTPSNITSNIPSFGTSSSMSSSSVTSSSRSSTMTPSSTFLPLTSSRMSSSLTSSISVTIASLMDWKTEPFEGFNVRSASSISPSYPLNNPPSFDIGGVRHEYLLGGIIIVTLVFLLIILMIAVSCTMVGHRRLDSYLSIPASSSGAVEGLVVGGTTASQRGAETYQRPPYDYIYRPLRGCYSSSGYAYADDGEYDDTFVGVSIPLLQDVTVV